MLKDRRAVAVTAIFVSAALSLTACFSGDDPEPDAKAERASPALGEQMRLELLVYNVEYGGDPATDRVIRRVDADVVGVLESYNRLPEIAERTATRTTTSRSSSCRNTRFTSLRAGTVSTP